MSVSERQVERAAGQAFLSEVPWDLYLRLRDNPGNRHVRMTYVRGRLDLMSPSGIHERIAYLLGRFIDQWTFARQIPARSYRTFTMRRADLEHALEPDGCYYLRHEAAMQGRPEPDLSLDPPPDLVVEVDITSPSRGRLPIYAALGVPEVWVWRGGVLRVLLLDANGHYQEAQASAALPGFPIALVQSLLGAMTETDDTTLARRFQQAITSDASQP